MFSGIRKLARQLLRTGGLELIRGARADQILRYLTLIRPISTDRNLIRLGGDGDGGYLVPDDLDGIEACFSPGVSNIATFEEHLASRGIRSFLADYSVDAAPIQSPLFHFEKRFLGLVDDPMYMTLDTWVKRAGPFRSDLILQMDIEGSEYDVIFDTSIDVLSKFRILIIEFHHLDSLLGHPIAVNWLRATFVKLLKLFDVVHIHPNNFAKPATVAGYEIPPIMEFSFFRKDRITKRAATLEFPHPLDRPNVPINDDYPLPKCWFDLRAEPASRSFAIGAVGRAKAL
jgi:hypothetical protein